MADSSSTTNTLTGLQGMLRLGLEDREFQTKRGFHLTRRILLQIEAASVGDGDLAGYVEAETGAGSKFAGRRTPMEAFKNPFSFRGRNKAAPVTDSDNSRVLLRFQTDSNRLVAGRVLKGVIQQLCQCQREELLVGRYFDLFRAQIQTDADPVSRPARDRAGDQIRQI